MKIPQLYCFNPLIIHSILSIKTHLEQLSNEHKKYVQLAFHVQFSIFWAEFRKLSSCFLCSLVAPQFTFIISLKNRIRAIILLLLFFIQFHHKFTILSRSNLSYTLNLDPIIFWQPLNSYLMFLSLAGIFNVG